MMRDNLELSEGLARIDSAFWRRAIARKAEILDAGAANYRVWRTFRSNKISEGMDNANLAGPNSLRERLTDWASLHLLYRLVRKKLAPIYWKYLTETPIGSPKTHPIAGAETSKSSLEFSYMLARLLPHLDNCQVVVEIGGGFGGLARIIKDAFPQIKYVILDLPEASAIQTYYLSMSVPGRRVGGMREVGQASTLDLRSPDFDYLLLPPQFIERLPTDSVDLFINTRSMMEMDIETVSYYLSQIQERIRIGGRFYCLNRYSKLTRFKDYPFDDHWKVDSSRPWPRLIDFMPHHELIAARSPTTVATDGALQIVRELPPSNSGLYKACARRLAQWPFISQILSITCPPLARFLYAHLT